MSEISSNKDYVVRLMKARCDCGTIDNYLNIEIDHGILVGEQQQPLLNANDHTDKTVIHFGSCKSKNNLELNMRKGIIGGVMGGFLGGGLGLLVGMATSELLEEIGIIDCKCKPQTPTPWLGGNEDHLVDGAPALMLCSQLACKHGGVITIISPEEVALMEEAKKIGEEPQEDSDETQEPKVDVVAEAHNIAIAKAMDAVASTGEEGAAVVELLKEHIATKAQQDAEMVTHICNDPEGYFTGNESFDFEKANLSDAQRVENYKHNSYETLTPDAINADGMITKQYYMENYHVGNYTARYNGCGPISIYNTLKKLAPNEEPNMAKIIHYLEDYGIMDTALGIAPNGVGNYLQEVGYDVSYVVGTGSIDKAAKDADMAIVLYATTSNVHYVAFEPNYDAQGKHDNTYTFYNELPVEQDVRTYDEFAESLTSDDRKLLGQIGIIVNKKY